MSLNTTNDGIRKTKVPIVLNVKEWKKEMIEDLVNGLDYGKRKYLLSNLSLFVDKRSNSDIVKIAEYIRPHKDMRYFSYLEKEIRNIAEKEIIYKITNLKKHLEGSQQNKYLKVKL